MFKNLKTGTKILFGFGIIILFTILISVAVFVINVISNRNLQTIQELSDFQMEANFFLKNFNNAQIGVNALYVKSVVGEYERVNTSYDNALLFLESIKSRIDDVKLLGVFRTEVDQISTELSNWKNSVDNLVISNKILEDMKDDIGALGLSLTDNAYAIYHAQLDSLVNDINSSADQSTLLEREASIKKGTDILLEILVLRRSCVSMIDFYDISGLSQLLADSKDIMDSIDEYILDNYNQSLKNIGIATKSDLEKYLELVDKYVFEINNHNNLIDSTKSEGIKSSDSVYNLMNNIDDILTHEISNSIEIGKTTQKIAIILLIAAIILGIVIALFITKSITKPILLMVSAAHQLSEGILDIDVFTYKSKDEIGQLTNSLQNTAHVLNRLIIAMQIMSDEHNKGDIDARVDENLFNGAYRSVAVGVNMMVEEYIKHMKDICSCLNEFDTGNFYVEYVKLPGKKASSSISIEKLRKNLIEINDEINSLAKSAIKGDLGARADINKFNGDWKNLLISLNAVMDTVITPINEAKEILEKVAEGNFDCQLIGNYQGDFTLIKNSINNTVTNIASYIKEISKVLKELASNNLDQEITRNYIGEFINIRDALNKIIEKYNQIIFNILSAASQVATSSKQISQSSMVLAQGTSDQASALEELSASIQLINENTAQNSQNAISATDFSERSNNNAKNANQEIESMLISMKNINQSSKSIYKIIKVIDDIAFQTNLLALNAAIEASKAGEYGRGFSVVAEEVRKLAAKSKESAKETTQLIEESIKSVDEGTKMAYITAGTLKKVLENVASFTDIINNIAIASSDQAIAIGQVTDGISQITDVVQSNSATSEETAAAAQELFGQAEILQNMVSVFNLKKDLNT